jgi:hypothetical protein
MGVVHLLEILGFYQDGDEELVPSNVFVAIKSDGELSCYCPIGQHSKLDAGYLDECKEISREKYLEVSKGLYTPSDYIKGEETVTKKIIFTISVHNSEYTEDFDEFEMPRSDEEEHFGELDDVESIIDFQYLTSQKDLEEHIDHLSRQYRVHRDKISYHQSIESEDVVW